MSVVVGGQDLPVPGMADGTPVTLVGLDRVAIERQLDAGADRVVVVSPARAPADALNQLGLQLLASPRARVVMVVHVSRHPSSTDLDRWCRGTERFGDWSSAIRLSLAAGAVAPAHIRRTVADYVRPTFTDEVLTTAPLAASELVSNALQHVGDGRFELDVGSAEGEVRLAVFDSQPLSWPTVRPADPLADAGRGLGIVAAVADAWGITAGREEKAVWCELR